MFTYTYCLKCLLDEASSVPAPCAPSRDEVFKENTLGLAGEVEPARFHFHSSVMTAVKSFLYYSDRLKTELWALLLTAGDDTLC